MTSLILPIVPVAHAFAPPLPGLTPAPSAKNAVIISSLDDFSPMRKVDVDNFNKSLTQAGYNVSYVKDGNVTVDFLVNHLNDYQVIIWRTDAYEQRHVLYWYIGERVSRGLDQTYATDLTSGGLDNSRGIFGGGVEFFSTQFGPNSLSNVKLMIIESSMSSLIASYFIAAGVKAVIDFTGNVDLSFNWIDYLTTIIVRFLGEGYSADDAVDNTITPLITMILRDPLDSMQIPQVTVAGAGGLVIT